MRKFIIILISSVFAFGQTVTEISYKNLYYLSESTANEIIKIKPNDELDEKALDIAIQNLYEQEYFEDIWVDFHDGVLTFNFKEKPSISQIDIKGYKNNSDEIDEFLKKINVKKGDMYDDKSINTIKEKIINELNTDGKMDSVVEVETKLDADNSVEVTFVVNQGENITIKNLGIKGLKAFEKEELTKIIMNKERDPNWGWMIGFNDGKLALEQLEYDGARLKDYYMQKGYLDAVISKPLLSVDFNTYSATLDYVFEEGVQYTVDTLSIEYLDKSADLEDFDLSSVKLKQNDIFNVNNLRDDLQTIKTYFADKGYAYTRVMPDVKPDKTTGKVSVAYRIAIGKKVFINDVIISGNTSTIDRVIRRELYLAPGDLYSFTDLKDSKNALGRVGYFETYDIKEKRISEDKIDLIVEVSEAPTGNIMMGGGYGSYDGFLINGSITDRNIFGSGIDVSYSMDFSERYSKYNINIYNPRINDSTYSGGFNLYHNDYTYYEYEDKSNGGNINIGKILNRALRGSLSLNYVSTDISGSSNTLLDDNYIKFSLAPSLVTNTTDDYFVPRHGVYMTNSLEYAMPYLGANVNYVKSYNSFQTFYGLKEWIQYDLIFRAKANLGYIADLGDVPSNERFFMGGVRSIRGYTSNSIYPTTTDGSKIGATSMLTTSLEASIPLIEEAKMRLTFFYDYGMSGISSFNEKTGQGYGAVIEWYAPIGPVQFVFGQAINPSSDAKTSGFEFTIGQRF